MLLILHIHFLDVLLIFPVLVFVVETDDGGSEPCGGGELQCYVVEVFLFGFVLLVGGFVHVGAAVLEFADGVCC